MRKTRITKECQICKKEIQVKLSHLKIGWGKFCSRKCYGEAKTKKGKTEMSCKACKTLFTVNKSYLTHRKKGGKPAGIYCSNKCKMSYFKGRPKTPEHLEKISGKNSHNWQGGKSSENEIIRHRKETRLAREATYIRDDFTCQECKVKGGKLNAHHIKPFSLFPELRFALDNLVTLCVDCHKKTDTYGSKINRLKSKKI